MIDFNNTSFSSYKKNKATKRDIIKWKRNFDEFVGIFLLVISIIVPIGLMVVVDSSRSKIVFGTIALIFSLIAVGKIIGIQTQKNK